MKILIVSDTHGRDEKLEAAVAVEQPFDYQIGRASCRERVSSPV